MERPFAPARATITRTSKAWMVIAADIGAKVATGELQWG
jgi:hypothetical protein